MRNVFKTFSKRQKDLANSGHVDVFQYDVLPQPFRVQVVYIWREITESIENVDTGQVGESKQAVIDVWKHIHDTFAREIGLFQLSSAGRSELTKSIDFFLKTEFEGALDFIDWTFHVINTSFREYIKRDRYGTRIPYKTDDAIEELNYRFKEHGIGYEFVSGQIVRVDTQYIHGEVVKPAIQLLTSNNFTGASEEFLKAHEHYRHQRYKEAIAEALKALESTLKTICTLRGWSYDPAKDTASRLIQIVVDNELIPPYLKSHFSALQSVLTDGLPTLRNKTSGHGQGANTVVIPEYFAAYSLHLAASNIVFLVEAHKVKPL